ncbi:MAG: hypothetical protein AB1700_13885, partial [Bacillota bacterium]
MSLFSKAELRTKPSFKTNASAILLYESKLQKAQGYDVFLSHSYLDAPYIYAIKVEIERQGFSVYVDWVDDRQLDRSNVTKETARRLKERMQSCTSLFYATTDNAQGSVWMPWELGYFDGIKGKVAVLPVTETPTDSDEYKGREYLGLYPY